MSLIEALVYYRLNPSKYWRIISEWLIEEMVTGRRPGIKLAPVVYGLDPRDSELAESISAKQRKRWKRHRIVPWQVVELLRRWGVQGRPIPRSTKLHILVFLDYLRSAEDLSPSPVAKEVAFTLYADIMRKDIVANYGDRLLPKDVTGKMLERADFYRPRRLSSSTQQGRAS